MKPAIVKLTLDNIISKLERDPSNYVHNPGKDFTRNRKLTFSTVMKLLIGMGGNSLYKELSEWFSYSADIVSTSAFVQQRSKIKHEAFKHVFQTMISECDEHVLYKGYRVVAIDGSDLRLPVNKHESISYIRNDETSKGYNLLHLDVMYDVLQHLYLDATIQPKIGMNEHKAFTAMVDQSKITEPVIVMADRGYESFNNIAHCQEKKWNYIIRTKEANGIKFDTPASETFDIDQLITLTRRNTKQIKDEPNRYRRIRSDTTFDYLQPKEDMTYDLPIRIVRFQLSDLSYETLFTNLPREKFPVETLKALYQMRWGIETSFRELKYYIGLASMHSKKTDLICQEIYAKLIMYNFASLISYKQDIPEGKRINFSKSVHVCYQYFKENITEEMLLNMISRFISPIRPGRNFQRNKTIRHAVDFGYRIS